MDVTYQSGLGLVSYWTVSASSVEEKVRGSHLHVAVVQDSYGGLGLHNQASSESVQDKVGEAHLLAGVQYAHESLNPDGNVKK